MAEDGPGLQVLVGCIFAVTVAGFDGVVIILVAKTKAVDLDDGAEVPVVAGAELDDC